MVNNIGKDLAVEMKILTKKNSQSVRTTEHVRKYAACMRLDEATI